MVDLFDLALLAGDIDDPHHRALYTVFDQSATPVLTKLMEESV
jgi:hypothetical protein